MTIDYLNLLLLVALPVTLPHLLDSIPQYQKIKTFYRTFSTCIIYVGVEIILSIFLLTDPFYFSTLYFVLLLSQFFFYFLFIPVIYIEHANVDVQSGLHLALYKKERIFFVFIGGLCGVLGLINMMFAFKSLLLILAFTHLVEFLFACGWVYFRSRKIR
jgi:hypothetical protein